MSEDLKPKGRGRGGVPLLPAGLWDSLNNGNADDQKFDEINFNSKQFEDKKYDDENEYDHDKKDREVRRKNDDFSHQNHHRGPQKDLKGQDWICPSCMNENWSWRTNCNMCNFAKPNPNAKEAPSRDGYGGGFNERQDRASSATVEVDEEGFDDFGRRVKKNTTETTDSIAAATSSSSAKRDREAKELAALKRLQDKYKHLLPENALESQPTSSNAPQTQKTEKDRDEQRISKGSAPYPANNRDSNRNDRSHRERSRDHHSNNKRRDNSRPRDNRDKDRDRDHRERDRNDRNSRDRDRRSHRSRSR